MFHTVRPKRWGPNILYNTSLIADNMGSLWNKVNNNADNFTMEYVFSQNDTDLMKSLASSRTQFKVHSSSKRESLINYTLTYLSPLKLTLKAFLKRNIDF